MKRLLKIIIPILLVVLLLAGAILFLLVFRPDITQEFFMDRADAALADGNYSSAVTNYRRAGIVSSDNPELALKLAQAYEGSGNYTKAEYTLVTAITANPEELDLYLALSRVYVAQDKLLDADQMLTRTANETIRAQLQELRPDAPVLQPEPGYYTEYIDVSLSYSGHNAYLSTQGCYPSMEDELYTEPVHLPAGETTMVAIVVSEDGLVSEAVTGTYTIGGVIEEATFADEAVESVVRQTLVKEDGTPVMTNELWSLTTLELNGDVRDLSDLENCTGLTSLTIHDAYGMDFSALSKLTNLETLDLSGCTVSSGGLSAIAQLPKLKTLSLSGCTLTDVSALSPLVTLESLDLSGNVISDISSLSSLTAIKSLNLSSNTLTTIAPLASMESLETLDITGNQVSSLSPLNNKTALTSLLAKQNKLVDLAPLATCTALETVDVCNNTVVDLSPLAKLASLRTLKADYNAVVSLPDFSAAVSLTQISVAHNTITSVSGLSNLPILNYVNIDYNQVSDLSPLTSCNNLVQVDAFGDPVTDVSKLQGMGIIVNYDPTATTTTTE